MKTISVAMVDDNIDDFFLVEQYLIRSKSQRYTLHYYSNYAQAIEVMLKNEHDIFLIDYLLGNESGIELLKQARARSFDKPVIFLTGYGDYDVDMEAMQAGASEFLPKDELSSITLERQIRYALARYEIETKLQTSMKEKEVLLQEIHHRVGNNLQLILSLLRLESDHSKNPQIVGLLSQLQGKIRSIALIHEQLVSVSTSLQLSLAQYLRRLTDYVFEVYSASSSKIELNFNAQEIILPARSVVTCGLILNEVLSNIFDHAFAAHAFSSGRAGTVNIELVKDSDNRITLRTSDNGVGIPKELDIRKSGTLGFKLIAILTQQLNGTWDLKTESNSVFTLTFPMPNN